MSKYMKIRDMPDEFTAALEDAGVDLDTDTVNCQLKPRGSTLKVAGPWGKKTFILVPSESFDYGDMVDFRGYVNLTKRAGWDVLGGPTAELCEKTDPSKPAWIIYAYTGKDPITWHTYQF